MLLVDSMNPHYKILNIIVKEEYTTHKLQYTLP